MSYLDDILGDMSKAEVFGDSQNLADDMTAEALVNFVEIDKKTSGMFFICELYIEKSAGEKANPPGSRAAIKLNLDNPNNQSRHSLLKGYICGLTKMKPDTPAEQLKAVTKKVITTEAQAAATPGLVAQPLRGVRVRIDTASKTKKDKTGSYTRVSVVAADEGNSKEEVAARRAELQAKLGSTK